MNKYYTNESHYTKYINKNEQVKHFPPANKEWKNSVYSYNRNILKDLPFKYNNLSNLLKSYIYSLPLNKKLTKSRRMRNSIRRLSLKKTFISMPEIKQTADKSIITAYIFDRENQVSKKRMINIYRHLRKNSYFLGSGNLFMNKIMAAKSKPANKMLPNNKKLVKSYKNKFSYNMFSRLITRSVFKKQRFLRDLFLFAFLKWILYTNFNIKINIHVLCTKCLYKSNRISTKNKGACTVCGDKSINNCLRKLVISKHGKNILELDNFKYDKIAKLNLLLSNYLHSYMHKTVHNSIKSNNVIITLFNKFRDTKNTVFINKFLLKELNLLKHLSKFQLNKFKYNSLIGELKNMVGKIYNKGIEFNIVNLKYLHLNSDMLLESISIKLRKKKASLLKVLSKSLRLIKIPKKFSAVLDDNYSSSKIYTLSSIYNVFSEMYINKEPQKAYEDKKYEYGSIKNILNSLKYKWITGIRLEAKGRLTRRYTASRAIFKYKTKGSLKNLDNQYSLEYKVNSPSLYMIRNQFRPNLQHSYIYSNKRIGTFGLKGWISSV